MMEEANVESNIDMKIKYWGVRGSKPTPLTDSDLLKKQRKIIRLAAEQIANLGRDFTQLNDDARDFFLESLPRHLTKTYGGNTTCIEVQTSDCPLIIIDAGTGLTNLGNKLMDRKDFNPLGSAKIGGDSSLGHHIHQLTTHYHWDHIQGFPFFVPAFMQFVTLHLYGKENAVESLTDVLRGQQQYPNFPVLWDNLQCAKEYKSIENGGITLGEGTKIEYAELDHPQGARAYAISRCGKKFVCATDNEDKEDNLNPELIALARDADVLYYDAQYTPEEYRGETGMSRIGWGHSTYENAVKAALAANAKRLDLGHPDPGHDDFAIKAIEDRAKQFAEDQLKLPANAGKTLEVIAAYEGLEHTL